MKATRMTTAFVGICLLPIPLLLAEKSPVMDLDLMLGQIPTSRSSDALPPSDTLRSGEKCEDKHKHCAYWASTGWCKKNPWMLPNCPASCNKCPEVQPTNCKCGQANEGGEENRIVNGVDAKENEYPWMVMLKYGGKEFCGASIISSKEILTAAHCTTGKKATYLTVEVGEHDRSKSDGERTMKVCSKIENPKHNGRKTGIHFDLAILRLCEEILFTKDASPVCLPEVNGEDKSLNIGVDVIMTGWGRLNWRGPKPKTLQKVTMKTIPRWKWGDKRCRNSILCAISEHKSLCSQDSGGPWVIMSGNNYVQIGVSSWTSGECNVSDYVGAARVSFQLDWIKNNMAGTTCPRRS